MSLSQRASEEGAKHYLMERDGYRELEGEWDPKWVGANLSMALTLLRRNGGLEDRVTMSKLPLGKDSTAASSTRPSVYYVMRPSKARGIP